MSTLYEKVGRRYVPVQDTEAYKGLGNGSWLVVVGSGRTSCRRLIEPDHAGFLAAALAAEDAMAEAVRRASDCRPRDAKLTARERRAYEAWRAIMGEETMWLTRDSAYDVAQAGIEAVRKATREGKGANREG